MSRFVKTGLLLVSLALLLPGCRAEAPPDSAARIDGFLSRLAQEQQFSGAVLVAQDGQILLSQGYGLADVENGVPNTPKTRFRIHWLTMPFTATAILMLQAEGRLDVQDPICRYVPHCPEYWRGITIDHLLTHSSGLSDWIQPWSSADMPTSSIQLIARFKDKPPYFAPGEELRYCSNGYVVLGYIIEAVSGQRYEGFLQQRVFGPLGMHDTGYQDDHGDLAVGYKPIGVRAREPDLLFQFSAGGLYSSVEDLYLWDQGLSGGRLIPEEYLETMFTGDYPTPSMDIEDARYGYGWFVGRIRDRVAIAHGGLIAGYTSFLVRFPRERVTIIVLRNHGLDQYDGLEIELAEMVFGDP